MNEPFFLRPAGKDYLWGGNRLNDDFDKRIELSPLAETWECSTHPDGTSLVSSGAYIGSALNVVLKEHPSYLGTHARAVMRTHGLPEYELPILIKLIDAKQNLSIQVHPDDAYAKDRESGQLGKTEMWYVLDAAKNAHLVYGLSRDIGREELRDAIEKGTVEKYLQKVPIKKNDVFYIPAGTIHAIGAGALIAEIQENSNLTYRLYDYNRTDKFGRKRDLHIEKALDVADLNGSREPVQPMRVLKYRMGMASELLCRCQYFQVERVLLNTERSREMVSFQSGSTSFITLLCVEGCGTIQYQAGDKNETYPFFKGDCIFIPADSVEITLHGSAQLLKVGC